MTKQITLEEALELVSFKHSVLWGWQIRDVNSYVTGDVCGDVEGNVNGDVDGNVKGHVFGDVEGDVFRNVDGTVHGYVNGTVKGKINGRKWTLLKVLKRNFNDCLMELVKKNFLN